MDDRTSKSCGQRPLNDDLRKWLALAAAQSTREDLAETLASLPALDVTIFDDLRDSLQYEQARLQRICTTFVISAENTFRLLDGSVEVDYWTLRRSLHTLLGSAGMVGARQVEYLTGMLKSMAESGRQEEILACASLLRQAMRRFEREFEARLRAHDGRPQVRPARG